MNDNDIFTRRVEDDGKLNWYWKRRFNSASDLKELM